MNSTVTSVFWSTFQTLIQRSRAPTGSSRFSGNRKSRSDVRIAEVSGFVGQGSRDELTLKEKKPRDLQRGFLEPLANTKLYKPRVRLHKARKNKETPSRKFCVKQKSQKSSNAGKYQPEQRDLV